MLIEWLNQANDNLALQIIWEGRRKAVAMYVGKFLQKGHIAFGWI